MPLSIRDVITNPVMLRKVSKVAFDTVDSDNSGYLEPDEIEAVMVNIARDIGVDTPTKEEVEEILSELDSNADGRISLAEFEVLIEQVLVIMAQSEEGAVFNY